MKLGLQYEPENLDVNKICSVKNQDLMPRSTSTYRIWDTNAVTWRVEIVY